MSGEIVYRKLTRSDVRATAEILTKAFADNAAYAWMHPRTAARPRDLHAFFERNLRWHLPLDLTWVACRGGGVVGTATLEPPGGVRSGAAEAIAHWLFPTVRDQGIQTFLRIAAAGREFRERYGALTQGRPYYHLHAVAVAPEFQGLGVGSMLVATTLRELERLSVHEPAPAVVSTQRERNLPLYERAGFVLKGTHQMGVRWGNPGFRTWFLLRATD
jgi:GNAT superfamily N-acetyltransferase